MSNKEKGAKVNDSGKRKDTGRRETSKNRVGELRNSPMMAHLLEALERGQDIGHFGRLTFVMVARHFLSEDDMLDLLQKQPDFDEKEARVLLLQVKERGFNPPKRERILQWMEQQEFPICPNPEDPNGCNVYRDLQFPENIYEQIEDFWEEKAEAEE